jgi:hypothetical protein
MTKDQEHSLQQYIQHLRRTGGRFYPIGAIISPDEALDDVARILKEEDVEIAKVNLVDAPDDALELVFDNLIEGRLVVLHIVDGLSSVMRQQLRYIADGIMHVEIHGQLEEMNSLPTNGQLVLLMNDAVHNSGEWDDSVTSVFQV